MTKPSSRSRLFHILSYLYRKSDEDNKVTTTELKKYLSEQGYKKLDSKTFREDMRFIIEDLSDILDVDIIEEKSSPNKYYWGERNFEVPELKMLIDAVSASHFISQNRSNTIIDKLTSLASEGQKEELKRNILSTGKVKSDNKIINISVDTINDAINQNKQISFQYYEYNVKKEKVLRRDGKVYSLSPYALYWDDDNYYVVGYSEKRKNVIPFRVDRIVNIKMTSKDSLPKPEDFKIDNYGTKVFSMFSGEEENVDLECDNQVMKYMIEQFGIDVKTTPIAGDKFRAMVTVGLSPTFYSWIFQFRGMITIIGPEKAKIEYRKMIKSNMDSIK